MLLLLLGLDTLVMAFIAVLAVFAFVLVVSKVLLTRFSHLRRSAVSALIFTISSSVVAISLG